MKKSAIALSLILVAGSASQALAAPLGFQYEPVWTHKADVAEIVAYDKSTALFFVTDSDNNSLNIIDAKTGADKGRIDLGGTPNSVAIKQGVVAIAVEGNIKTDPGTVKLFNANSALSSPVLHSVSVGSLPDMLTFTPDGKKIIVANEGEAKSGIDPNGSVSVVDISSGISSATTETVGFTALNGDEAALKSLGVRLFPGKSTSQDLEPEYIALSKDGSKAYVTLQENNSLAIIDLNDTSKTPTLVPLGTKDHSLSGQGIDASDKDGIDQINTFKKLAGMYQPDAIASYNIGGKDFLVTANEGDARDEDTRISKLTLDPTIFPNAAALQENDVLGRLGVSSIDGDIDGDGDYDALLSYGGRSFSIWDDAGSLIWDSGDMIEQLLIDQFPALWADGREDNKGPEPEGVAILQLLDHWFAFIGLERSNAIMAFDISDPASPFFVELISNAGDMGPEGLLTIGASESFDGNSYLVVANEISGTTTLYRVSVPEPAGLALMFVGLALVSRQRKLNKHASKKSLLTEHLHASQNSCASRTSSVPS